MLQVARNRLFRRDTSDISCSNYSTFGGLSMGSRFCWKFRIGFWGPDHFWLSRAGFLEPVAHQWLLRYWPWGSLRFSRRIMAPRPIPSSHPREHIFGTEAGSIETTRIRNTIRDTILSTQRVLEGTFVNLAESVNRAQTWLRVVERNPDLHDLEFFALPVGTYIQDDGITDLQAREFAAEVEMYGPVFTVLKRHLAMAPTFNSRTGDTDH